MRRTCKPARSPRPRHSTAPEPRRLTHAGRMQAAAYGVMARAAMHVAHLHDASEERLRELLKQHAGRVLFVSAAVPHDQQASQHTPARPCCGRQAEADPALSPVASDPSRHTHVAAKATPSSNGVVRRSAQRIRRLVRRQQALHAAQRRRREARANCVAAAARSRQHSQQLLGGGLHGGRPAR